MIYRVVALVCWSAVLVCGIGLLAAHQFSPGASGAALRQWPEPGSADRPRLVMFIHPHCPCTPASLRNFATVVASTNCEAVIYVVARDPAQTPNGQAAAQAPGVACRADPDGCVAKRFGAMTSGHAFLYDRHGRLVFEGGITGGRGHAGDNPGLRAVTARLSGSETALVALPVYGCPLSD